jgi:predicted nucleic acid-binding protein
VITLAELELSVLVARDSDTRGRRLATLTRVREQTAGLPADERVASAYARLAAAELAAGRKPRVHGTWIAATALVHQAEVWTQDQDFTAFRRGPFRPSLRPLHQRRNTVSPCHSRASGAGRADGSGGNEIVRP